MKPAGEIPRPLFLSSSLISFFAFHPSVRRGCSLGGGGGGGGLGPVHRPIGGGGSLCRQAGVPPPPPDAVGRSLTPFVRFVSSRCPTCPLLFLFSKQNNLRELESEVNGRRLKFEGFKGNDVPLCCVMVWS